jgi:hypothetical protein
MQKMTKWTTILLLTLVSCGQVNNKTTAEQQDDKIMSDTYPEKFNKNLTADDKKILDDFRQRRTTFNEYLNSTKKDREAFTCPSCGYPTLSERNIYEICHICDWEDDGQDDKDADEIWGGPNGELSLTESRLIIGHELQKLADSLNGTIVNDPDKFFLIFKEHNDQMEIAGNKIKGDTDINDPLWEEWRKTRELIKTDLIEKKK